MAAIRQVRAVLVPAVAVPPTLQIDVTPPSSHLDSKLLQLNTQASPLSPFHPWLIDRDFEWLLSSQICSQSWAQRRFISLTMSAKALNGRRPSPLVSAWVHKVQTFSYCVV